MPPEIEIKSSELGSDLPLPKKARIEDGEVAVAFKACQRLLSTSSHHQPVPDIPSTLLQEGKTRNDIEKLRQVCDNHGFRTSIVHSPRAALSVYKDSCHLSKDDTKGKEFLTIMFGMHNEQENMENFYAASVKNVYCLILFCNRLREACPTAVENSDLDNHIRENEQVCRSLASIEYPRAVDEITQISKTVPERVAQLTKLAVQADPRLRIEQLQHEYDRILFRNSTLSNAHVQLFVEAHDCCIKDIYFKRSHLEKYERITIYLYDPEIDELVPPRFIFMPALKTALEHGPETMAKHMVGSFWSHLLRRGYFATQEMKANLTPNLEQYFLSGIAKDPAIPTKLNAHFEPVFPLSFYFYGKAGAGKSSLVRNFSHALNETIEEHVDPEILVRFVKQNLNKRFETLKLELDLRPNNNDMSVMAIISQRQMTLGQSKPGLVLVDLEEMPSNRPDADPNQLATTQLISQRFSGRKGVYHDGATPRNSAKRGISGDATIIPVFTSNYELDEPCLEALQKIEMFSQLKSVHVKAISGKDRDEFAHAYVCQCVKDRFRDLNPTCKVDLDIPLGDGDTRPLVRHLRMLAFYTCALLADSLGVGSTIKVSIVQKGKHCSITALGETIELKVGTMENIFPITPQVFDRRTADATEGLRKVLDPVIDFSELSVMVDFWLAKTLAPAVIMSNDSKRIKAIVAGLGALNDVHCILGVDAGEYKMMKSLYDPNGTPNLRDDILAFGREALVAVELQCETIDAQLCIREIIEDTPSMTAFSSEKSALYKSGLLFGVYVKGKITPELESRASLII